MTYITTLEELQESVRNVKTLGDVDMDLIQGILYFGHYKNGFGRNVLVTDAATGETLLRARSLYFETSYEWFERRPHVTDGSGNVLLSTEETQGDDRTVLTAVGSEEDLKRYVLTAGADRPVRIFIG